MSRNNSKRNLGREIDDLREEVSMLDTMLTALVDVLEQKGLVSHTEWERKIKEQLGNK
ncbi:MAG: hypothetical protein M1503_03770 [Thaumarchaeota archaeon]|nr:hypothetical protein [Nitrososphaerota archaeon]MCL5317372.1 hypothetical protein [Nitrososphaerota archaeon]